MVNFVFVAAGQCGNQLAFDLLTSLLQHSQPAYSSSTYIERDRHTYRQTGRESLLFAEDESSQLLAEAVFRTPSTSSSSSSQTQKPIARAVCLDTEPKVIENCVSLSQSPRSLWRYNPSSILHRHGGAGNNWALGYSMTSGEFLEKSIDCIRREVEMCDSQIGLVFLHSLAGGTGSGLGTRITEACEDEFSSSSISRMNLVISPYHFGEVIVQYYNSVLCLSKLHNSSQGIFLFENEIAQSLCQEMHGIEKPKLSDLNHVICHNLLTLFLPKLKPTYASGNVHIDNNKSKSKSTRKGLPTDNNAYYSTFSARKVNLLDDLSALCSHPGYRFCQIRVTPQTSKKSIDYTYDSWNALFKTIQRMQLSGTLLERHVRHDIKSILSRRDHATGEENSPQSSSKRSPFVDVNGAMTRSLSSIVTFHGEKSQEACTNILQASQHDEGNNRDNQSTAGYTRATSRSRATGTTANDANNLQTYDEYIDSHSEMFSMVNDNPIDFHCSPFMINKYKRSTTVVSNDQTILPILQRSVMKSQEMFEVGAYVHQYTTNGLEHQDFYDAFQSMGSIIHNYSNL